MLKKLQQTVNDKAGELGISAAILSSKKELEKLILSHEQTSSARCSELNIMQGWRQQCIGQRLLEQLSK